MSPAYAERLLWIDLESGEVRSEMVAEEDAQRWLQGDADYEYLQTEASAAGGHVCLFRGGDRQGEVRQTPAPTEQRLQLRLKQAFDPDRILNPGRLYSWL